MAHTFTNLLVHVIFSTKDREPYLTETLRPRVLPYMGGIVRELGGAALRVKGPDDYVHLLLTLPATLAIAEVMRVVKTNSSRWIHESFPESSAFAWQTGYGAFSVSKSNVDAVTAYIDGQEQHHKTVTFQEEFLAFLKRHGISYDPKYIWE
jgi:REP element-mobilizing transposase RayT